MRGWIGIIYIGPSKFSGWYLRGHGDASGAYRRRGARRTTTRYDVRLRYFCVLDAQIRLHRPATTDLLVD